VRGKLPAGLYLIEEPEARVMRKTPQLKLICSHEPATPRSVGRPWPRQVDWRTFLGGQGSNLV
jgi:hypothetical protein